MKKIITMCIAISFLYLFCNVEVHAAENVESEHFISSDIQIQEPIAPGDTIYKSLRITNTKNKPVKVRIHNIENQNGSELFSALQTKWGTENSYHSLQEYSKDWFELEPKESKDFEISFYFPEESGNAYQNQELSARVVFECQADENSNMNIKTGDTSAALFYIATGLGSIFAILFLLSGHKRKRRRTYAEKGK